MDTRTKDDDDIHEPQARMRKLIETSHGIDIDKNISIARYFHSGREMIKSASQHEGQDEIEEAFVLYLRYMTLFLEKLVHHPEWKTADRAEKKLVKNECNRVFDLAESLKLRILKKYEEDSKDSIQKKP